KQKHALINNEMKNTVIGAFMTGIRSSNSLFINALLNTPKFISEIEKNLGATINQITIGAFKLMEFKVPTQEEQIAIGNFFKQLDDTIALHQREVEKYKKIKQAYLEKMFI
ncbi:MAG: restriction endonuclease subunit S, partial [[Actinobacillus] rossii]|nr:restriction endonuclease subunit S [[Actinobacillus] rossii]